MNKVITAIIFTMSLTGLAACSCREEPPTGESSGAKASFTFTNSWEISTESDSLESGSHDALAGYGISAFNLEDISHTVLRDMVYCIEADNIKNITFDEYAQRTDKSVIWKFPSKLDLAEGDWLWSGYTSEDAEKVDMPMSLSRSLDKTVFDSDGYQHAEFVFSFDNTDFDSAYLQIIADEHDQVEEVDAAFIVDTFSTNVTYSDILKKDAHKIYLCIFKPELSQIEAGVEYSLSVDLNIKLRNSQASPVLYKPFFSIGVERSHDAPESATGSEVEMPSNLLPDPVRRVSVSTETTNSWRLTLFRQKTSMLHEIAEYVAGNKK